MTGGQDHSGDAVRQLLAEISERAEATPAPPWEITDLSTSGGEVHLLHAAGNQLIETFYTGEAIVRFVASARADVPRLAAALAAVLDLHQPVTVTTMSGRMDAKKRAEVAAEARINEAVA